MSDKDKLVQAIETAYVQDIVNKHNEFIILNKDKIVASFDENLGNFVKYGNLPYGFSTLATWIESRYRFCCARDVRAFFNNIGINPPIDYIDIVHCVSLHDTFWVKRVSDSTDWNKISPYRRDYSKIVETYALEGIITKDKSKDYFSPVMETNGNSPHTWKWHNNEIYFVKAGSKYTLGGSNSGREPFSEYYASIIAKYLGFNAVEYSIREHVRQDKRIDEVTECKIFTNEEIGTTTANDLKLSSYEDVIEYCKKLSTNAYKTIIDMLFLDCLLLNTDRHFSNIEFFVNNETQEVIDIAPIFDNNYSMLPRFIENFDVFKRSDYVARDNRTFEELYSLVKKHGNYRNELIKLKDFKLEKPKKVNISDARLKFLNEFLQMQVKYLLSMQ